jgi:alpha-ketoglutarate-dependent taurine dioxygenase
MDLFNAERYKSELHSHNWSSGDFLVIDNWRVMHGRGGGRTAAGRILLRAMVL